MLKQTHSDYVMNIFYITVKFTGTPVVPDTPVIPDAVENTTTFTPSPIFFNLTAIDWKSKGALQFS